MLSRKKTKVSGEIPVASTADIAFLLLIFFLCSTTFPKDSGLAIVLPEPSQEVLVAPKDILYLLVHASGVVEVRRGESQQVQQVRAEEIEGVWRQEVAANPNLIAAVKTAPDAPYRLMLDVLDALRSANAERISLQLLEG